MTPSIPGRTLSQLALCLLLIGNLLVWSASWNAPAFQGGEFKQLGDCSPPFLVGTGTGDSSPDGDTCSGSASRVFASGYYPSPILAAAGVTAVARIRMTSYPVLPQAPPGIT